MMQRFVLGLVAGVAAVLVACTATVSQTCVPTADGGMQCSSSGGVIRQ